MLHSRIVFSQVHDLTLLLAELHKVPAGPLFQPTQTSLQSSSPFWSVYFPTQLGVIRKLHQATLDPVIQITQEDIE